MLLGAMNMITWLKGFEDHGECSYTCEHVFNMYPPPYNKKKHVNFLKELGRSEVPWSDQPF